MNSKQETAENLLTTKIISVFFPIKPLELKFSDNFISSQITDFISKLKDYTEKVILYKIDKERFYTFDYENDSFDDTVEIVDNKTIVVVFSIDKKRNIELEDLFADKDFQKNINIIRVHRKRVDNVALKDAKPSYIFYTINSIKLLTKMIDVVQESDSDDKTKTFFILSANNAKRSIQIDYTSKSFSTEKICRMNYISTINTKSEDFEERISKAKKQIFFNIKK